MKLNKHEQKYRAKQQLASKFTQKSPANWPWYDKFEYKDKKSVNKLVDKICK